MHSERSAICLSDVTIENVRKRMYVDASLSIKEDFAGLTDLPGAAK